MNRQRKLEILFIIVAILCTFFSLGTGDYFSKKVSLEVGQIAPEDVYAPIQIENEVATERKKLLAQQSVQPEYKVDDSIKKDAMETIRLFFQYCHQIIETYDEQDISNDVQLEKNSVDNNESVMDTDLSNQLKQEGTLDSSIDAVADEDSIQVDKSTVQSEEEVPVDGKQKETIDKSIKTTQGTVAKLGKQDSNTKNDPLDGFEVSALDLLKIKSPIPLYEDDYRILLDMSEEDLFALEGIILDIVAKTLDEGVKANTTTDLSIKGLLEKTILSSIEQKVAYEIINSQIKPNTIIDEESTNAKRQENVQNTEPVYILQGEKIIGQGDRVTEERYLLLAKIGYLESEEHKGYMQYVGVGLVIGLILFLLMRYIYITQSIKQLQFRQSSLICILYIVSLGLISVFGASYYIFLPLATAPILIAILINKDLAMIVQFMLVIIAAMTHKGDNIYIIYLMLTGLISISLVGEIQQRKGAMKSAITVGTIYGVVYLAINLAVGIPLEAVLFVKAAQAFLMGMIQVILVVGSLPLWEVGFGFVTPSQLLELTNPDQPILKRMLIEATGTYYHSLLVANLAEAAANEIGANPLLARVGGYYHDIGKLNCSNYFKENQVLENPHDYMEAISSAKVIISHATSGVELANAYKLPQCVKDMIIQHHGTGVVQYFYIKAKQDNEEVSITDFRYPGPKPQTKEAALIMLADVVEATVRAMQGKIGVEITVEELVRKMVKQKLDEGQLDECPLYISDIEKIIGSFSKMLKGMYHERIEYPDKKG